ncbi:MAG: hypothetical protein IPJ84_18410 [Bdellovibrionales bacterium]|nr:hypothetical protein [Bdellovibrionales bacterium]
MTIIAKSAISIALAASCANATATTENLFHPDEAISYCAPRSHALFKILKKLGDGESYLFTNKFITGGLSIPKGCTGELDYPEMADRSNPNERILVAVSCPNSTPARFHDFFFSTASFSTVSFRKIHSIRLSTCGPRESVTRRKKQTRRFFARQF